MKLSTKILLAFVAICFIFSIAQVFAVRAAFAQKQRVDFKPGSVEQPVQPFKVVVLDSKLSPRADLFVEKAPRFALASVADFWKVATVSQSGDTLFIRQNARLQSETNDGPADFCEIKVLCPSGLTAVRSNTCVWLREIEADSLTIVGLKNELQKKGDRFGSELVVKNCKIGGLALSTEGDNEVKINEGNQIGNLRLTLRDSSDCEVNSPILGHFWLENDQKSTVELSGENVAKLNRH